jgi:hypothetical protein
VGFGGRIARDPSPISKKMIDLEPGARAEWRSEATPRVVREGRRGRRAMRTVKP